MPGCQTPEATFIQAMAIWTSIHGRNGLLSTQVLQDADYLEILNRVPLDELKILREKIESVRDQQPVPDFRLEEYNLYTEKLLDAYERVIAGQKSTWRKQAEGHYRNDICYFGEWDGFGFSVDQDIITLSGPMYIFGSCPPVQQFLAGGPLHDYHIYFTSILKAFKSDFILYAPEWYGIVDGDTETKTISDLLALEDWRKKSSEDIKPDGYVYFEDLPLE